MAQKKAELNFVNLQRLCIWMMNFVRKLWILKDLFEGNIKKSTVCKFVLNVFYIRLHIRAICIVA